MNKEALKKISILGVALGLSASPLAFASSQNDSTTGAHGAEHQETMNNQPRGAAAPTGNQEEWQEGGGEGEGPVIDPENQGHHLESHATGQSETVTQPRGAAVPTGNKEEWQEGGGEDEGPVEEVDINTQTQGSHATHQGETIDSHPRGAAEPTGNTEEWQEGGGEQEGPVVE
ncbi:hypothetical protein [Vreelandella populi]|uniref:Uncharacterized protein n=1 Tax=Vreelandella populi TaxID=2498858 RepID=A0A433L851_9GAMM|nr:hypothetical protein [Halomonas populi]RUR38416.1 hypothetical protein ELY25_08605 [Halomonas populi]RUR43546.1 hypothetical protein ELY37_17790 [Halomonas populi]RUR51567.1 hypothetical protein ELY40_17405 [Halomonas populi]